MIIKRLGDFLVLEAEEDLLASRVGDLTNVVMDYFKEAKDDYTSIVLDVNKIKFIDSRGISFVVALFKTAKEKGKDFSLDGLSEEMYSLCKMMRLDEHFEIDKR